jgi:cytoskeletal protein CcmA (bactofilin family)
MFSERENKHAERIETLIGEQCNIVGNLTGGGLLKIDGSIDGDLVWQDDLIIGSIALVNGNIKCRSAAISGQVKGNVICEATLTIENSGKVVGDITVKNLVIKEGGSLDGKCSMITSSAITEVLNT